MTAGKKHVPISTPNLEVTLLIAGMLKLVFRGLVGDERGLFLFAQIEEVPT